MEKNDHHNWLNKIPWYNTYICLKLYGSLFEYFITHAISDRYNFMCSLVAHDKLQPSYKDDEGIIGDRSIPKNETTETLKSLGATLILLIYGLNCLKRIMTLDV